MKLTEVDGGPYIGVRGGCDTLENIAKAVTANSLSVGFVPRCCPICRNPTLTLYVHHWSGPRGKAIREGMYRRLCPSCNDSLRTVFGKVYPSSWEEQFLGLSMYFERFEGFYSDFCVPEGWWSRLYKEELELYARGPKPVRLEGLDKLLIKVGLVK